MLPKDFISSQTILQEVKKKKKQKNSKNKTKQTYNYIYAKFLWIIFKESARGQSSSHHMMNKEMTAKKSM